MLNVLDKDNLTSKEVKGLVKRYLDLQEYIKSAINDTPTNNIEITRAKKQKSEIEQILSMHAQKDKVTDWASSIPGIGVVLGCGIVAYIEGIKTVNEMYTLAGFVPRNRYKDGEYSVDFKRIGCKIGECFVGTADNEHDIYGHIYKYRRNYEMEKNDRYEYSAQAENVLAKNGRNPAAKNYKWHIQGKLSPSHIRMRARRYAVKIFLQHLFCVYDEVRNGRKSNNVVSVIMDKEFTVPIPGWNG